jgi:serine/threonine protein kinase
MSVTDSPCYEVKVIDCGANKFAILQDQKLGEGAYAVVKRAVNTVTGQEYAVKIIRVANKDSRDTAVKELEIASELEDCINLVRI